MKIRFCGSSSFSVPFLDLLHKHHQVISVITTPAKPQGRGLKCELNPVQIYAEAKALPCFAPAKLSDPLLIEQLGKEPCEVLVIASYGKILPASWLSMPGMYPVNVHPSLLPKYRGAAPLNWQIINGEEKTGVTIFEIAAGVDTGDILGQIELPLRSHINAQELLEELAEKGGGLLLQVLENIQQGKNYPVPQDHSQASYARKLKKEDALISWNENAAVLERKVRGLFPWPGTQVEYLGQPLQLLQVRAETGASAQKPGTLLSVDKQNKAFLVQTGEGALWVERVKPAGKKEMDGLEFINGRRLKTGDSFLPSPA